MEPIQRRCSNCKMTRFPEIEQVSKGSKYWIIYKCRMCGMKDIEDAPKPKKNYWTRENYEDRTETDK